MQRLKTRSQFQAVMDEGATVSRTAHFALHCLAPSIAPDGATGGAVAAPVLFAGAPPWIGAVVPKRWARRAVTRNTLKRQIYTVAQDYADRLPHAAHIVRLRAGFDRQAFPSAASEPLKRAVRNELQQLFDGASRAVKP
ncbi:MAG: hypothetical protein RL522_2901 [Pseudomonadota bacterium]